MNKKLLAFFLLCFFGRESFALNFYSVTEKEMTEISCAQPEISTEMAKDFIDREFDTLMPKIFNIFEFKKFGISLDQLPLSIESALNELLTPQPNIIDFMTSVKNQFEDQKLYDQNREFLLKHIYDNIKDVTKADIDPLKSSKTTYDFSQKTQNCLDLYCILDRVFGKSGLYIFYAKLKYNVNLSHYSGHSTFGTEYIQAWSFELVVDIINSLEQLPDDFVLQEEFGVKKFIEDYNLAAYQSEFIANATGAFFDLRDLSSESFKIVFLHEYMHRFADEKELDKKSDFFEDWNLLHDSNSSYPSIYAMTSATEDLAEALNAYRLAPQSLQKRSPERYKLLKDKAFNGLEFTEPSCENFQWF